VLPDIMKAPATGENDIDGHGSEEMVKSSTFGEAEVGDITAW